ncbi:MAG: tryptophan-rich sensory protein [Hyphomicrobiales bacterium]|nr:tryptophan-rich sensory protein [Hyphomicrobiales bacterium]
MNRETETQPEAAPFRRRSLAAALLAALPVVAAAAIGSRATLPAIPDWYAGLAKPAITPPNWVFGPVWTALYALMIVAFHRVLTGGGGEGRGRAIALFLGQMALNALWSVAFFGLRSPGAGVAVILALDVAVAATLIAFYRRDRIAGLLLAPYLAWIGWATALNLGVWWLAR